MIVSIKLDEADRKHSAAAEREIALFLFSVLPTRQTRHSLFYVYVLWKRLNTHRSDEERLKRPS